MDELRKLMDRLTAIRQAKSTRCPVLVREGQIHIVVLPDGSEHNFAKLEDAEKFAVGPQ